LNGLPPVGGEVSDPTLVEVEKNSFEGWTVHARTLPATRDHPAAAPSIRSSTGTSPRANMQWVKEKDVELRGTLFGTGPTNRPDRYAPGGSSGYTGPTQS
jgi:hypothetical protein